MCKVCSSLGQKWGNERAITGINIILTCPFTFLTQLMKKYAIVDISTKKKIITPGRIGLKFDIFKLMFYEILVMHIHNSHLVYNFYEQGIKFFPYVLHVLYVIIGFITFIPKQ